MPLHPIGTIAGEAGKMHWSWLSIPIAAAAVGGCKNDDPPTVPVDTARDTDTDPIPDTAVPSVPGAPWDLTVIGQGYEGGNGLTIRVKMADEELVQVGEATDVIEGGGWQVRFRDVIDPDESGYYVAWWVDLNGNGECGGGDVAFLQTIVSTDADQTQVHTFNNAGIDPQACVGF